MPSLFETVQGDTRDIYAPAVFVYADWLADEPAFLDRRQWLYGSKTGNIHVDDFNAQVQ